MKEITKSVKEMRSYIKALELETLKQEQLKLEPVHYFSKGLYARELTLPAQSVVTGKIHKYSHLTVILKGQCRVTTPFGIETITGPCIFESQPDTKRAVYAITETTWITFHPTEKTDPKEIEKDVILTDYSDVLNLENT
tara:strand:+ start:50 stop:466 length:417 start_codon:yes stop_codon:yes gene_type:complete